MKIYSKFDEFIALDHRVWAHPSLVPKNIVELCPISYSFCLALVYCPQHVL